MYHCLKYSLVFIEFDYIFMLTFDKNNKIIKILSKIKNIDWILLQNIKQSDKNYKKGLFVFIMLMNRKYFFKYFYISIKNEHIDC